MKFSLKHQSTTHTPSLHPSRDWLIILALTLIGIIGSVVYNVSTFYQVTHEAVDAAQTKTNMTRTVSDEKVNQIFQDRERARERYTGSPQFVDPSSVSR